MDKARSNRNEVWFRGNNVREQQVTFKTVSAVDYPGDGLSPTN